MGKMQTIDLFKEFGKQGFKDFLEANRNKDKPEKERDKPELVSVKRFLFDYSRTQLKFTDIPKSVIDYTNSWVYSFNAELLIYLSLTKKSAFQLQTDGIHSILINDYNAYNLLTNNLYTVFKQSGISIDQSNKVVIGKPLLFKDQLIDIGTKYEEIKRSKGFTTRSSATSELLTNTLREDMLPDERAQLLLDFYNNPKNHHRDLYKVLQNNETFKELVKTKAPEGTAGFFSSKAKSPLPRPPEKFGPQDWARKKPGDKF